MTDPSDKPNVVALPPRIYLAALVGTFVMNALLPLRLPVGTLVGWAGGGLMVAAVGLAITARRAFARAGTNVNPMQPATAIVASGPYRWTRNPMYAGMTALLVGFSLATRMAWALILLAPVLAIMHWGVVLREERYLTRKFGAEYEAYRAQVRRYL